MDELAVVCLMLLQEKLGTVLFPSLSLQDLRCMRPFDLGLNLRRTKEFCAEKLGSQRREERMEGKGAQKRERGLQGRAGCGHRQREDRGPGVE